ncbi:MAG: rhamnan synthesis F family protein [Turneriella sp.]|nr:rhamnan synthesis F family protein [Leptospiraceae bacterium]MCX7632988.1 rhamnan synthesis F family protein [Turneriella sp.]
MIKGNFKSRKKYLCIFACHDTKDLISQPALHYLRSLAKDGFDVVVVSTSAGMKAPTLKLLSSVCLVVIIRKGPGRDFTSWRCGLFDSGIDYARYEKILFTNDSCYAPLYPMQRIFHAYEDGILGLIDSYEGQYHLMSYFLLFHRDVITHPAFTSFWQSVRSLPAFFKPLIIRRYEIGLSQFFQKAGFKLRAWVPVEEIARECNIPEHKLRRLNPTHALWRYLIEKKQFPALKVDLFRRYFLLRNDNSWREVIAKTHYDIRLILEHQNLV